MEISFESKQLREICENEAAGERKLGEAVAAALRSRLADCEAASSPLELVAGRPKERGDATISVELCNGHHLVFTANHPLIPTNPGGGVDWAKVHRIRILSVEVDNAPQ